MFHILNQTFVDLKNHLESEIQNLKHNVKKQEEIKQNQLNQEEEWKN